MRSPVCVGERFPKHKRIWQDQYDQRKGYRPPSRTPRTSSTWPRSARKGTRSVSSVSCGSLNHDETGTALLGWKIYDAGELSMMIVSAIGRPSWERSYTVHSDKLQQTEDEYDRVQRTRLHVVAPMIITAFPEQSMCNDMVYVQLVQDGIGILRRDVSWPIDR